MPRRRHVLVSLCTRTFEFPRAVAAVAVGLSLAFVFRQRSVSVHKLPYALANKDDNCQPQIVYVTTPSTRVRSGMREKNALRIRVVDVLVSLISSMCVSYFQLVHAFITSRSRTCATLLRSYRFTLWLVVGRISAGPTRYCTVPVQHHVDTTTRKWASRLVKGKG